MLPETIYCYEINFIVTSKSRALMKQLIVMDQLWHLVRTVMPVQVGRGVLENWGGAEPEWCCNVMVNSLTAIGGHDRPYFYELRARVVSLRIFVRYQRLMARKIAELFGLNRGVRPFYAACCFDELSRGSFSCLLNASFKTAVSQRHNSIFWAKIDDHDVRRGDMGQILAQWRRLMASRVALDLLLWAMHSALYRLIRMANEMASKVGAFVRCRHFFVWLIIVK